MVKKLNLGPDLDSQFGQGLLEPDTFLSGKKKQFIDDYVDNAVARLPPEILPLDGIPKFDPKIKDLEDTTRKEAKMYSELAYILSPQRQEDEQKVRDRRNLEQGQLAKIKLEIKLPSQLQIIADEFYSVKHYLSLDPAPNLYGLNLSLTSKAKKPDENHCDYTSLGFYYDISKCAESQGFKSAKDYMSWYLGRLVDLYKQEQESKQKKK